MCNELARTIWEWCIQKQIWLSATYLPGVLNVEADKQSRLRHDNTEWQLNPHVFQMLVHLWGAPSIDLFASRLNYQITPYVAWKPDPHAAAVDAFSIPWESNFYAFPPFSLLGRALMKIQLEKTEGILIAPLWTTQHWFSKLTRMITDCPFLLPRSPDTLKLPQMDVTHPLPRLQLAAFRLSGDPSKTSRFRQMLRTSYRPHGGRPPADSMNPTSEDGSCFVVHGTPIHCHRLWRMC